MTNTPPTIGIGAGPMSARMTTTLLVIMEITLRSSKTITKGAIIITAGNRVTTKETTRMVSASRTPITRIHTVAATIISRTWPTRQQEATEIVITITTTVVMMVVDMMISVAAAWLMTTLRRGARTTTPIMPIIIVVMVVLVLVVVAT